MLPQKRAGSGLRAVGCPFFARSTAGGESREGSARGAAEATAA